MKTSALWSVGISSILCAIACGDEHRDFGEASGGVSGEGGSGQAGAGKPNDGGNGVQHGGAGGQNSSGGLGNAAGVRNDTGGVNGGGQNERGGSEPGGSNAGGASSGGVNNAGMSSGGAMSTGGSGGAANTGGAGNGGGKGTGGTSNGGGKGTGGSTGGGKGAGGSTGTGGTSSTGGTKSTGGTSSTGGVSNTGGTKSTGGATGTGGASSTGGTKSTGGVTSTGGTKSTGGTSTGGVTGTGGATSTACTPNPCQNGGSCRVSGTTYACTCQGGFTGSTCTVPIFQPIPSLSGTVDGCLASGVSGDGAVVVGYCTAGTLARAYRFQSATITELRPLSGGNSAKALGVNRNGLAIVGTSADASGFSSAVRWAGDSPLNYQGLLQQDYSNQAVRTNGDGSISVGVATRTGEYDTGVRWAGTSAAPTYLASGQGNAYSFATGIDSTGNTVVGYCSDESEGFVWTAAGGYKALLGPAGETETRAGGVSDDGRVIAGTSVGNAVRWVGGAAVPESLGAPANPRSLSSDGSVIVGKIGTEAFVWNTSSGMRTLSSVLSSLGVGLTGWVLQEATDVSDDGTIIVGYGTLNGRQTGFRVTLPAGS